MKRTYYIILFTVVFSWTTSVAIAINAHLFTSGQMTSSLVKKICQDKYGFIWEGTEYGLNRFDGYRFATYYYDRNDTTSIPGNEVSSMLSGKDGSLWIGFANGLARYDYSTNSFVRYHFPGDVKPRVSSLVFDKDGNLFIGTAGYGLFRVDKGKDVLEEDTYYNSCGDKFYSVIYFDVRGRLWRYSSQGGLSVLPSRKDHNGERFENIAGQVRAFFPLGNKALLIVSSKMIARYDFKTGKLADAGFDLSRMGKGTNIQGAMRCHNGDIILGTSGKGAWRIRRGIAEPVDISVSSFSLPLSSVNELMEDRSGNLWVNCYRKGLLLITEESSAFRLWSLAANNVITGSSISSISKYGGGVLGLLPNKGLFRFDDHGAFKGFLNAPSGSRIVYTDRNGVVWLAAGSFLFKYNVGSQSAVKVATLPSEMSVSQITDDGHGHYFISSPGQGLAIFNLRTHAISTISMNDKGRKGGTVCNDWINDMLVDERGLLWLCTADGVSCMEIRNGRFITQEGKVLLKGENCSAIAPFSKDKLVIGTSGNLYIYDIRHKKAALFPKSEQLDDKSIRAIISDKSGDLWISTMNGIWQYDHKTGNFIGHISGNGLVTKEYLFSQAFNTGNDLIGFGTPYGITVFRPDDVRHGDKPDGKVYLTSVVIGGKEIGCTAERYDVANGENTVSMSFSLLDYRNTDNIIFQYRINGGEWIVADNYSNTITFNRMRYGDYTIEVRALSNGIPLNGTKKIKVSVAPPWYLTPVAFVCYVIAMLIAITILIVYYNRRKNRELEEAKMRFLINTTHDIRSPLTLIVGPLKKLRERTTDADNLKDIETIDRNARRLQTLVSQILDKRKIDKRQLQLHCRETDLVSFTENIFALYQYNAKERGITLKFDHPKEKVNVWIDRSQFDKVIANLLSNAFKYTPDGGEISISLSDQGGAVTLTISDTGKGIAPSSVNKIFERFYQGDNSRELHVGGTGIGLNLCRELTQMHGGTIKAGNRTDGRSGAVFTVTLPVGKEHLKPEQIEDERDTAKEEVRHGKASRNIRVMIVDDDTEIAQYIKQELSDWYRIDIFTNGKEALSSLLLKSYDIVVSDVVMPEMDGITLLKKIKGNTKVSDIPVILLTSQSEVADRLEGLKHGADAYIAKPFSMDELHVTIDNLLDNVRRLRGKFSGAQQQADKIENVEVQGNDDELMKRIMESVNKHLDDPDFNVEKLCEDVAVSRTQLHRKMKEMTGISTGEFIRNLRLDQAERLIKEGKINVTQVAYAVGFNNPAHFATVFKKRFGASPTEYAKLHGAGQ